MNLNEYLKKRIEDIRQAIEMLPHNAFLKSELLAYQSILEKLEELEK